MPYNSQGWSYFYSCGPILSSENNIWSVNSGFPGERGIFYLIAVKVDPT